MTNTTQISLMPHHRLRAYGVAVQLLGAVRAARIRDRVLRDQALRAAKSACLNCAEGAGRFTRADKARAYTVARGEAVAVKMAKCQRDVYGKVPRQMCFDGGFASRANLADIKALGVEDVAFYKRSCRWRSLATTEFGGGGVADGPERESAVAPLRE